MALIKVTFCKLAQFTVKFKLSKSCFDLFSQNNFPLYLAGAFHEVGYVSIDHIKREEVPGHYVKLYLLMRGDNQEYPKIIVL